ncbi:MAG: radical SAM protein [Nanoarchaeota archaeon]|nr:radical SAM protein [Nanoarchaeota archaeon]
MDITNEVYVSPYSCYINLTSKCNLRCKHCFGDYSGRGDDELNIDEWKEVIDDLIRCNVFYVVLSGGEVTQSPIFKELIDYLTKKGMYFILTTNGVFSDDMRDFIVDNKEYLISVKISLDGPDRESHGFIRLDSQRKYNPTMFDITMNNIYYFKKMNISISIATVLHKENIRKMEEFQKLIKEINPIDWFISPIIPIGRGKANKFISEFYEYYDNAFWESVSDEGKKNKINIRIIDMPVEMGQKGLSAYSCAAAINFCEIHSDGTVSPCTLSRVIIPEKFMKFENIRDKSLQEIWDGKVFEKFRGYMNVGCDGCKMLSKCNKCVAQSFRYFGDGKSPTPFCIRNGRALGLDRLKEYGDKLKNEFDLNIK